MKDRQLIIRFFLLSPGCHPEDSRTRHILLMYSEEWGGIDMDSIIPAIARTTSILKEQQDIIKTIIEDIRLDEVTEKYALINLVDFLASSLGEGRISEGDLSFRDDDFIGMNDGDYILSVKRRLFLEGLWRSSQQIKTSCNFWDDDQLIVAPGTIDSIYADIDSSKEGKIVDICIGDGGEFWVATPVGQRYPSSEGGIRELESSGYKILKIEDYQFVKGKYMDSTLLETFLNIWQKKMDGKYDYLCVKDRDEGEFLFTLIDN